MNLAPGDIFEKRYEARSELGGNEFSVVYRATSKDTGRDVAIRILLPPPSGYPEGFENRFMSESKRVSKLRHAGTVHLESYGAAEDGSLYLVTEYISGSTLAEAMAEEEVPVRDVLGLIKRLAQSLGEAHGRGIIHRELKPGNIAIPLRRGVLGAKLRDFGITKYVEQEGPLSAAAVGFGSPRYMSPEQILGDEVGFASNIYSLGLVMFELLAHEPCVPASSPREILATHLSTTEFVIPATVPPAVTPVLKRMIAKSRDDRFETTDELLDALSEIDRSQLGLTAQLKVAKMVAALNASEDAGGNAADTILDPNFLDPDTDEATKERYPAEDATADLPHRAEVLTPTNVVVDKDVTQLAEESSAPTEVGLASENEPTDELPDKTKPQRRTEKPRVSSSDPEKRRKRSSDPEKRRSSKKSSSRRRSSSKRKSKRSKKPSRRSRRTPPPAPDDEDRVSPWVALGALVGAVAVALIAMGGFLYLRSQSDDGRARVVPREVVDAPNPLADPVHSAPPSDPTMIPNVSFDLGTSISDMGLVPTGCGITRKTGWQTQTQVLGLTEVGYEVYVPTTYTGAPVPLVLAVHPPGPPGLVGRKWVEHVRLTRLAEELGAVMLAPVDKSIRPWMKDLPGAKEEFDRVLEHATTTFCIDLTRVIGIGMSTGAQALERYSCEQPGRFFALGLVAHWVSESADCALEKRPATIIVNGLRDRVSPTVGGGGCYGMDMRLPLADAQSYLRKAHGCGEPVPWAEEQDGSCESFGSCASDLVMCQVPEGVHGWPGSQHSVVRCIDEFAEVPWLTRFPTTQLIQRFMQEQLN